MKISYFISCFILLSFFAVKSQNYFIAFKDKPSCTELEIKQFLSQKSIDRRTKQNIAFDSKDCPLNPAYLDSLKLFNLEIRYISKWMNGAIVICNQNTVIDSLKKKGFIEYIHDLQLTSVGGIQSYDSAFYGKTWSNIDLHGIQSFHNKGNFGENISIAIFDGGFSGVNTIDAFQHLFIDNRILETYNFVEKSENVYKSIMHGTNVLSLISANTPKEYVASAPKVDIALFLTENAASESILEEYYWLLAAEKADSLGIDIINSSLGYYDFDYPNTNHTFSELDGNTAVISKAAKWASQKGMLVVNSSGNSNNTSAWPHINFPADVEEVLTVGSINSDFTASNFSSRGPINNSYLKPELVSFGVGSQVLNSSGKVISQSGTSFCAPVISGLAALVWSENPDFTAQELKEYLIQHANNFDNPSNEIGYGYPVFKTTTSIEKTFAKNILSTEYLDLNGRYLNVKPIVSGFYIKKTTFEDYTIEVEKIFLP